METRRFFEKAFPTMVHKHFSTFLQTKGSISFSIEGEGDWTLAFGDTETPVHEGCLADAELKLRWKSDAFHAFLAGTLVPAEAIDEGALTASGDVALLETLGTILRPRTSLLDVMMSH